MTGEDCGKHKVQYVQRDTGNAQGNDKNTKKPAASAAMIYTAMHKDGSADIVAMQQKHVVSAYCIVARLAATTVHHNDQLSTGNASKR